MNVCTQIYPILWINLFTPSVLDPNSAAVLWLSHKGKMPRCLQLFSIFQLIVLVSWTATSNLTILKCHLQANSKLM